MSAQPSKLGRWNETVVDAAYDLLTTVGFKKMSVEAVARKAGVSRAAVYLHFKNKQDLTLAVIDRKNAAVIEAMRAAARSSASPEQRAREILRIRVLSRLSVARSHAASMDQLLASIREKYLQRRRDYSSEEAGVLAEVLVEGRLSRDFEFDDAFQTASSFITATASLLPYSLSVKEIDAMGHVEQQLERLIDLCMRSISRIPERSDAAAGRSA